MHNTFCFVWSWTLGARMIKFPYTYIRIYGVHLHEGTVKAEMQRASAAFAISTGLRTSINAAPKACRLSRTTWRQRGSHATRYLAKTAPRCTSPPMTENVGKVQIRRASKADIGTASRVLAKAFTEDFLRQEGTSENVIQAVLPLFELVTRIEISGQLRKRVGNSGHAILIAEVGDSAIGCAEIGILDISKLTKGGNEVSEWGRGGGQAYVGNVGVLREYRGNGVGRRLLKEVGNVGESWGMKNIWLCVEAKNVGGIRFYEKLGFGCVAQEPSWYDEIGKRRRLFLCSCDGEKVGEWRNAKTVGSKLGVFEYLRYCLYDLRQTRQRNDNNSASS